MKFKYECKQCGQTFWWFTKEKEFCSLHCTLNYLEDHIGDVQHIVKTKDEDKTTKN